MTGEELSNLKRLIVGARPAENGLEKHFLRVLSGEAIPCSGIENEWYSEFYGFHFGEKQQIGIENREQPIRQEITRSHKALPMHATSPDCYISSKQETFAKVYESAIPQTWLVVYSKDGQD